MSSLASEFLKLGRVEGGKGKSIYAELTKSNAKLLKLQEWTHDFVYDRLRAPLLGSNIRLEADQCAERYVFDEDAPKVVRGLIKSGELSKDLVWEMIRLPATNVWIEFPVKEEDSATTARIGMMLGHIPNSDSTITSFRLVMALVARSRNGNLAVVGLLTLPQGKWEWGKTYVQAHWFLNHDGHQLTKQDEADCTDYVCDLVDSLFLINTPRVCELREGSCGPRKKKVQERTGLPLVEYRNVVLRVGVGNPRYKSSGGGVAHAPGEETAEARSRRLHRVTGHFRVYKEGRETPLVTYVPKHWRGDPALGVLLHERKVQKPT